MPVSYNQAISNLKAVYGLGYTHNPGGGAFFKAGFPDCQIGCQDDEQDYKRLVSWLREQEAERLDETLASLDTCKA